VVALVSEQLQPYAGVTDPPHDQPRSLGADLGDLGDAEAVDVDPRVLAELVDQVDYRSLTCHVTENRTSWRRRR